MLETDLNDNNAPGPGVAGAEADAHGRAALLLVESVLHGLIEQSVFTVEKAVEIVGTAAEVRSEIGTETGEAPPVVKKSLALLQSIAGSLQADLPTP